MPNPSRDSILAQVQMRLPPRRTESGQPARADVLENALVDACEEIAVRAAMDPKLRRRLVTEKTFTLDADGEILLTHADLTGLSLEMLWSADLYVGDYTEPADFYSDLRHFLAGDPHPDIPRWTIDGGSILVRVTADDSVASAECALRDALYEPYVPLLTADAIPTGRLPLPASLEREFVSLVRELYLADLGGSEVSDEGQGA